MRRTAIETRDAIREGKLTPTQAVGQALDQIEAVNGEIQAATQIFRDEALAAASEIEKRLSAGEDVGPLAGVPFTVKENINTLEGQTTGGSKILENFEAPFDATIVARLKAAGAVLVAKSNMDEFGMGSSTENSAYQVTKNPWRTTHVPGGSSGGAAALAAATSGMLHFGSDTGGSIRQPASCCGVTGFKPTYGRVPRFGLLAFGSSLDQIGPLGASVLDCAMALEVIAGKDTMDTTSRDAPVKAYAEEAQKDIAGLRIGIADEFFPDGIDSDVRARVDDSVAKLEELGAEVKRVSLPHIKYANQAYVLISAAEASSNLSRYDGIHYGHRASDVENLDDLYCRSRAEGFGPEVKRRIMIGAFVLSSGYYDAYYLTALKVRALIRQDFEKAFEEVDVIVSPTSPVPSFPIGDRMDDPLKLYAVDVLTVPANLAAVPGISVPCGLTEDGLPVGMQIYGRHLEDDIVLRFAHAFQQSTDHHRAEPSVHAWGDA